MKFDYVIIGSGLGGGTLAYFLDSKSRIAIIEAGSNNGNSDNVSHINVGIDFRWPITRSIEKGGTSNLWHGVLAPLDEIDFENRSWIPHSGWPIKKKDLDPFYKDAAKYLNVKNYDIFNSDISKELFHDDLKKVNISNLFNFKFFQQPLPPLRIKKKLESCQNVTFFSETIALELLNSLDDTKSVRTVKCFCKKTNQFIEIEGHKFIIASGALETPRLLLNSSKMEFINNKNIGKYLMDHPMGNFLQIKFKESIQAPIFSDALYSKNNKAKVGIVLSDEVQEHNKFPNNNFFLRPSFKEGLNPKMELVKLSLLAVRNNKINLKHLYNIVTNINLARQILTYKLSLKVNLKWVDLFLLTEQTPFEKSQVRLSKTLDQFGYKKAEVDWQLSPYDKSNIKDYINYVYKHCFSESQILFTVRPNEINWDENYTSAAHHVGTARMSKSPDDGVVDKNLKVFNCNNLYVCDGSIFTTSGNVNSGFTIIALAIRLAKYLNEKN